MGTTMTKVATFTLPIVVLDFGDGEFGYEIGVNGALNFDSGFKSFDEAEGAARKAAEFLEQRMLAEYADAASTIATEALTPGSIKALLDVVTRASEAMGKLRVNDFTDGDSFAVVGASLQNLRDALAPFKPPQTEPTPITPDDLADILLLIEEDYPLDVIAGWTDAQREEVAEWAGAVYLKTSDNPVKVPPKPAFLAR